MAFFLRAARPAGAVLAMGAGVALASKFQPHLFQHQLQIVSCDQKVSKKTSKMSIAEKSATQDTALYQAYKEKFGASKTIQLTFADIQVLLKGIGIKNIYLSSRLFQAMDEDKGGTVDFDEMNHFCHTLAKGTRQEKAKFMFDACDTNDNGMVEPMEMRRMVKNLAISCHETLPTYVLLKSEQDVALCEDLEIPDIATVISNRLVYQMFHDIDNKKTGSMKYPDFEKWIIRNSAPAQEFGHLFALFDHLLSKH